MNHIINNHIMRVLNLKTSKKEKVLRSDEMEELGDEEDPYWVYLNSETWYKKRQRILLDRGNYCEKCGDRKRLDELDLHHKNYDNELGTEKDEDLMLICKQCHVKIHSNNFEVP